MNILIPTLVYRSKYFFLEQTRFAGQKVSMIFNIAELYSKIALPM